MHSGYRAVDLLVLPHSSVVIAGGLVFLSCNSWYQNEPETWYQSDQFADIKVMACSGTTVLCHQQTQRPRPVLPE